MQRVRTTGGESARRVTQKNSRNGQACRRCNRFGTFAPNALVCDRCMGTLPLIFVITITVTVIGGDH